jgi:hypothetical protein
MRRIVRKKKGHSVLAVLVLPQLSMKFMLHQKERSLPNNILLNKNDRQLM